MVFDPVCRMAVDPSTAAATAIFEGEQFYFCSANCHRRFLADPRVYRPSSTAPRSKRGDQSCSMAAGQNAPGAGPAALAASAGFGLLAATALLGFYFGVLTLLSGWEFTSGQFASYWGYIVALGVGFGVQVGLFTYLRKAVHAAASGKVVAATGATSGAAMISCCAHYLVNLLPVLGATGLVSLIGQYQRELFWFGLAANLAGIAYIGLRLVTLFHGDRTMHRRISRYPSLVLIAFIVAMPLFASAQTTPLPKQVNDEGQVIVAVTPLDLSTGANAWRFEVQINTHVAPLDQDLVQVAVLSDANGHDERPVAWDGDMPGGHHRKGILSFKPIDPLPDSVTLKIRQVGSIPERSFTWKLTKP